MGLRRGAGGSRFATGLTGITLCPPELPSAGGRDRGTAEGQTSGREQGLRRRGRTTRDIPPSGGRGAVRGLGGETGHGLDVSGLVALVGGRTVLHGVTCAAPAGQVIGALGPPGSGKSTLLRCVIGAQEVSAGEVRVLGMRAGAWALRRRVGYAPGATSIYLDLSAGQNVRYFAAVWGTSRAAADRALAEVEMSDLAGELAGSLPVDLQARLSLACALVAAPEMVVVDELTEGLDPVSRRDLWGRLGTLAARGTTVVVASQVLDDALLCDRVLLLCGGRLVGEGTPERLLGRTGATTMEEAYVRLCGPRGVQAHPARPAADRAPVEVAR